MIFSIDNIQGGSVRGANIFFFVFFIHFIFPPFLFSDPAITITSISPTKGPTSGGTQIRIFGNFLRRPATARVGTTPCQDTRVMQSHILCIAPESNRQLGTYDVTVLQYPHSARLRNAFTYEYPRPTIASVTPNAGPKVGGTPITITGTDFLDGATANICASTLAVTNFTTITCTTRSNRTLGSVDVVITNPDGQKAILASGFNYRSN